MLQLQSIDEPFSRPEIVGPTLGVLKRAEAMGVLERTITKVDLRTFRDVLRSLGKAGIARETARTFELRDPAADLSNEELLRFIKALLTALDESPAPDYEWRRMVALFQPELADLAELLRISLSSLRRYSSKERETPDHVAARLHFLVLVTSDLVGAYNDMGVRNWFRRKRTLLDGKAPKDLLGGGWQPGDPGPERVRALARSLASGSAT